ncbi:MAG TPA: hypothetical protein PKD41_18935 [Solidesulfovibrio sp.]|nr:hypothetical protein [Solidesulfovibrio sp.]
MDKFIRRLKEMQWQAFFVVCVTLALLVGAELAARAYLALRERGAPPSELSWDVLKVRDLPRSEAYRGEDWVEDFRINASRAAFNYKTFYSPYWMWKYGGHEIDARTDLLGRYDPNKPRNKYVNVDRYGFVVTENPHKPSCREKRRSSSSAAAPWSTTASSATGTPFRRSFHSASTTPFLTPASNCIIITGKPPALPGDSQSLTVPRNGGFR